jgi:hypothetical protein
MSNPAARAAPEIETARLRLRAFKPDDLDESFSVFGDAEVIWCTGSWGLLSLSEGH